eukprot:TRINITY_DN4880_c0_g1_i1.p1 TRINITY_DN4880_c0_g1~~TRINITY_DN4880_c0_g1_i1.p1  ORF type:complete len:778 (-),score=144.65 TRINITY_DN4880_c0_g1_i1:154-2487(-)
MADGVVAVLREMGNYLSFIGEFVQGACNDLSTPASGSEVSGQPGNLIKLQGLLQILLVASEELVATSTKHTDGSWNQLPPECGTGSRADTAFEVLPWSPRRLPVAVHSAAPANDSDCFTTVVPPLPKEAAPSEDSDCFTNVVPPLPKDFGTSLDSSDQSCLTTGQMAGNITSEAANVDDVIKPFVEKHSEASKRDSADRMRGTATSRREKAQINGHVVPMRWPGEGSSLAAAARSTAAPEARQLTCENEDHEEVEETSVSVQRTEMRAVASWREKRMSTTLEDMITACRESDIYMRPDLRRSMASNWHGRLSQCSTPEGARATIGQLARDFLGTRVFEVGVICLIGVNALWIGIQAELLGKRDDAEYKSFSRTVDQVFVCVFVCELSVRFVGEGRTFLSIHNSLVCWNAFDMCLIIVALLDEVVFAMGQSGGPRIDISVFRLLRIVRVLRIFQTIRLMRYVRDLQIMVAGIFCSIKSLTWAILLLAIFTYITAIIILNVISLMEDELEEADMKVVVNVRYDSLPKTMFTLYKSIIGGVDWGEISGPLFSIHFGLGMIFTFYVTFAILCVMNIVTGVFVENANSVTMKSQNEMVVEDLESRKQWLNEVKDLFEQGDSDNLGHFNAEKFEVFFAGPRVQAACRKLGVEVHPYHAQGLFDILDFDGDGTISKEEFALGLDALHGSAKSIDVCRIKHQLMGLYSLVESLADTVTAGGNFRERKVIDDPNFVEGEVKEEPVSLKSVVLTVEDNMKQPDKVALKPVSAVRPLFVETTVPIPTG